MFGYIRFFLLIFITGFAALSAPSAASQEFENSNFERFIEESMTASHVPGLAVVLFDETGVTYEGAFGIADKEKTPVTLETPFQLASVSKSFAALIIVQLAAEGQVSLDDPIVKYLPYFRTKDETAWQAITIRHILSHRSGLSTFDGNRGHQGTYSGADALERAVKSLEKTRLKTPPGDVFAYSNANYKIAGALIETVTGQSFETVVKERIFGPLDMKNSYVRIAVQETVPEATGFRQWFGVPIAHPSVAGRAWAAAGGVTASARDLATYVQAVAMKDPRIVPAAFADDLITPQGPEGEASTGYALGWMIAKQDRRLVVYHSGLNPGFASEVAFFPETGQGGVVLTNLSGSLQADVPDLVLSKGLNLPTGSTRPSTGQYILVWGMVANVIGLVLLSALSMVRFSRYVRKNGGVTEFRRVSLSLWLFTIAFIIGVFVPKMNGLTLGGMRLFSSDVWLCLVLSILILVIWGAIRLIYPRRLAN